MDEARRIRFYVAPVLFLMSLVWGAWFDPSDKEVILNHLDVENLPKLIGLAAGGGFVVFAFGYIIGTLTYAFLRAVVDLKARLCGGSWYHEAGFSSSQLRNIWRRTGHPPATGDKVEEREQKEREQELSAVILFDFGLIREKHEGVHEWLVRRYTAFIIGSTSVTGLCLSFIIGPWLFSIPMKWQWWFPVFILIVACFYVACWAWKDGRRMGAFMAEMPDTYWKKSADK
jgi:hypothetical protein